MNIISLLILVLSCSIIYAGVGVEKTISKPPSEKEIQNFADSDKDGVRDDLELFIMNMPELKDYSSLRKFLYNFVSFYSGMMSACRKVWRNSKCLKGYIDYVGFEKCTWSLFSEKKTERKVLLNAKLKILKHFYIKKSDSQVYGKVNNKYAALLITDKSLRKKISKEFCAGKLML